MDLTVFMLYMVYVHMAVENAKQGVVHRGECHVRAVHHRASGAHCHLAWGAHLEALPFLLFLEELINQSSNRS
jgi:hypothetical protein